MFGHLTQILALLAGLSLAAQASIAPGSGSDTDSTVPPAQKCPSLKGRYSCSDPFMLTYKNKKKVHEMKVVQSDRDGYSLFLFEAKDGVDGFWAIGDGAPHAFDSEAAQAWGFKQIDTESNCPEPESLEIKFMIQHGPRQVKTGGPAQTSGLLTFQRKGEKGLKVTARAYGARGRRALIETANCQRIEED
jgi:hypothetical protein